MCGLPLFVVSSLLFVDCRCSVFGVCRLLLVGPCLLLFLCSLGVPHCSLLVVGCNSLVVGRRPFVS